MPTTLLNSGVQFPDNSIQTSAGGVSSVIKLDVNLSSVARTGTLTRFGSTVSYYDLAVSGITDYTKCVIIPSEFVGTTIPGFLLGANAPYFTRGGTIELISNSVLRFITTTTGIGSSVTARGRLQIVQFK